MNGNFWRKFAAVGLSAALLPAQTVSITPIAPVRPSSNILLRPYQAPEVPGIRSGNSGRLNDLLRAGTLYLTAQDAIALALENNVDIEVARYNPLSLEWRLERSQAGGALPGIPSSSSQAGSVASGQGVGGSQAAAGVSSGGGSSSGGNAGNASIAQIGPVTQNLDPSLQETTTFTHKSSPQQNSQQSVVQNLVTNTRVYNVNLQEGFLTGGTVTLNYNNHYLNENAPTDVLNPSVAPAAGISFQHNLLRGFGVKVNSRNIAVAKINFQNSDLSFKTQVVSTVSSVLNAYYTLVADYEDVKAKRGAEEAAKTFLANTRRQVELGALAPLDITSGESLYATSQKDTILSETSLEQDEFRLKLLLSRNGLSDAAFAAARIVPVDKIPIPEKDDLPPIPELLRTALANRSDLEAEKQSIRTAEISTLGTRNGVLPTVVAIGGESQAGLAGTRHPVGSGQFQQLPDPYFVGGVGTALGQVFRHNFPTERIGVFAQAQIYNRQATADQAIDALQLRQQQLTTQKDFNQLEVDLRNSVVALQQARARYDAAFRSQTLQQQLLDAERRKFQLETSTPYNVIQQQRDLVNSQSTLLAAQVTYIRARVTLDQTLGTILDVNRVSLGEVKAGRLSLVSTPVTPPAKQ
jgi:outer membrane protein TolC